MCPQESSHLTLEFKNFYIILSDLSDINKYSFQNKKEKKLIVNLNIVQIKIPF